MGQMDADSDRDVALRLHKEMNKLPKRGGRRRAEEPASEGSGRQSIANDSQGTVEPEYEVEKILSSRKVGKRTEYLVKWQGYDKEEDNTWEPAGNLHMELISDFENSLRASSAAATPLVVN